MMKRIPCPYCGKETEVHFYDDDTSKQDAECDVCEKKFTYQIEIGIKNVETVTLNWG